MNVQRILISILVTLTSFSLQQISAQAIPQTPIETLKSDRLLEYGPLQDLLRAGNWKDANAVTSTLMLKAGGQLERGYLVKTDIDNFPCNDLLTVNRLWQYYSNDRFGYGPQSHIWVGLKGKNYEDSLRFEKKVGWGSGKGVINNLEKAPIGHLPFRPASGGGIPDAWGGGWIGAMPKRLNTCINPPKPKPVKLSNPNSKIIPKPKTAHD